MTRAKAMIALAVAGVLAAGTAAAAPNALGKNGAWSVFVDEEGGKTCYISATPSSQSPGPPKEWHPTFYVTRGSITNGRDEPSVHAGYDYEEGSQATVSIGSDTFTLFTDKQGAWIENVDDERRLIEAMKAGATMIVKGKSARGTVTTDTYSLSGVTAGINKLSETCP